MLGLAGAAACLGGQAASAQQCRATFAQANVWTGQGFEKRDVSVENGRFVDRLSKPAQPVPANWMFLIPPFADAHTHELNEPTGPNDPDHRRYLEQGIFYALNPSNIRSGAPDAAL